MTSFEASAAPPAAARYPASGNERADRWILLLIGLFTAFQLWLAVTRSINWDEFHFLSQVHEFARGTLDQPLQTLHVELFRWLADTDLSAVDQVVRGRVFMFACLIGTCGAVAAVAGRFTDRGGAMLCVLAYASFSYVIQHGTAFRTDPLAAFLTMGALAILARSRLDAWQVMLASILLGTGFMVTIKIVLYLPAFAGIAWLRWSEVQHMPGRAARIASMPLGALAVAAAIYLWHSAQLAEPEAAAAMIGNSGASMFGLSPNIGFSARAILNNVPFVACLVILVSALQRGGTGTAAERIALAGLAAPVLVLIVYTNTFPYFFAFILPPVAAALAGAIRPLRERFGLLPVALFMAASGAFTVVGEEPNRQDEQRRIEQAVNAMFPEPTAYFDFPGLLPRHDKANFFMTVWGFRNYQAAGRAHFVEVMEKRPVPILLAVEPEDSPTLAAVMNGGRETGFFHPDDVTALRETYREAWGPLYLAGTKLEVGEQRNWRVRVPGSYTLDGALAIDGTRHEAGDVVRLERGTVSLSATGDSPAGLIWGDHIALPAGAPPARPYWRGF